MKKILLIWSLILLVNLPILFIPCFVTNICDWWMNMLWAFLWLIWFIWTIIWYILYNILYYIWKNNKSDFVIKFYRKTWLIVSIYLFLLISFLILSWIYNKYINNYSMEIILMIFSYLLLCLLIIIPIILISWKQINTKKTFIYIFIIFFIIIWWFYLLGNYIEKKENKMQEIFDEIIIWDCKDLNFNNYEKSFYITLKVICDNNKYINDNLCELDKKCKEYICNWNESIKAFCSDENICKCN